MIILLSPAKTLDLEPTELNIETTLPRALDQTMKLVGRLKKKKARDLKKMMSISDSIADLNVKRYDVFSDDFNDTNSKASVLAFKGDVYIGLEAFNFDEADALFARDSIRILSGLYGLLRPYDLMQPYRLEMGTKLKIGRKNNLYQYWGDSITEMLNEDLKLTDSDIIINLASNEYFKAINQKIVDRPILNIAFKEMRNGELKFVSFNAKKARGLMTRYIVKNKITDHENLKGFDVEGYVFEEKLSNTGLWTFVKY